MPRFLLLQFSWVTSRRSGGCGYCTPPSPPCFARLPRPEPPTQTMFAWGPVWRWAFRCAGVGYSMAQAWSNTYEPVLSLHLVTACAGGIILFRPGICPCWWQFPIADHRVIHRRRMFVNLECLDRLLHRPLRKSRPDLPFHICNH